jgi:hypothetical protein
MVEKHIVLNYDLGLKGDYSSLYTFLDNLKAMEIGNCNAAFAMEFSEDDFKVIFNELKEKIAESVNIEKTDRIYMTATDSTCKMRGGFLFGGRKRAIWEGYGVKKTEGFDQF